MRKTGTIILIFGIAAMIGVAVLFFIAPRSASSVASEFMNALGRRDINTLIKLTYLGDTPPEVVKQQWEQSLEAGKFYRWSWVLMGESDASANTASVRIQVIRDIDIPGAYPENFALPMTMTKDGWKVEVNGISRAMYPALPRG